MIEEELKKIPFEVFDTIMTNSLYNSYAMECVTMGLLKPGEKVPIEKFAKDLALEHYFTENCKRDLEGYAIDENEMIKNKDFDYFAKEFLFSALDLVFVNAPLNSPTDDDDGVMDYKDGLREYIKGLYPLFRNLVTTKVQYDFNNTVDNEVRQYRNGIPNFLSDIRVKKLAKGKCVRKYFKTVSVVPYYVQRLVANNNKYILVNNDTDSLDYKLALLSAVIFLNPEHSKLLELKMRQWETVTFS